MNLRAQNDLNAPGTGALRSQYGGIKVSGPLAQIFWPHTPQTSESYFFIIVYEYLGI